jgi:hypothetical protein
MTDGNCPNGNQVFDLAAVHAAKDPTSTTRLTAELFEAAGVEVADTAPPAPDGLVRHQPITSKAEILRLGTEAMERLTKSRSWEDWKLAMPAVDIGRTAAMLEAGVNKPAGRKYSEAFRKWARLHSAFEPIANLDKSDRSRLFECFKNLDAIDAWRARLSPARQLNLNYPPTVLAHWKKSQQPASPADTSPAAPEPPQPKPPALLAPTELRRQLEILGLPRFCKEVLPEDWRRPLSDTALALATPDALITMLERKLSSSKTTRAALKNVRKAIA